MTQSQPPPHPYPAPQHAAPEPKKTPLAVKIVVIAAILVWVGGCGAIIAAIGGEDPTAVPAPTTAQPTPSAPPTAQSYASLLALRDAVIKAGYPCPRWERFAKDDGPEFVKEAGQCSDEDVLSIYPDEKAVQQQLDTSAGVVILIAGPNWTLNIPESHRERVATALGGKIVDEGELDPNADPNTEPPAEPEAAGIGDTVRDDGYEFVVSKSPAACGGSATSTPARNPKASSV